LRAIAAGARIGRSAQIEGGLIMERLVGGLAHALCMLLACSAYAQATPELVNVEMPRRREIVSQMPEPARPGTPAVKSSRKPMRATVTRAPIAAGRSNQRVREAPIRAGGSERRTAIVRTKEQPVIAAELDGDAIFFAFGSALLTESAIEALKARAAHLHEQPELKITLEGHTQRSGSAQKNELLSEQRVQAAKAYLVRLGIKEDRIRTTAIGEAQPPYPDDSERNRCVVMIEGP
jgi:outer membrane protein OmpA-like peptidoglycan-associated protein